MTKLISVMTEKEHHNEIDILSQQSEKFIYLLYLKGSERQREFPFTSSRPNECNSQGSVRVKPSASRQELYPRIPNGQPEPNYLSHHSCLPRSVMEGSWCQELQLRIEHRHSNMGCECLSLRLNTHSQERFQR